jgi:DNA-binding protein HU-beta
VKNSDRISLVGFGSFSISKRAARKLAEQDDLTPQQVGCLWLASRAPEWLHGLFCSTSEIELVALMVKSAGGSDDDGTKPGLIARASDTDSDDDGVLDIKEAQRFVDSFKSVTTGQLVLREVADLDGFGAFSVRENKGRQLNTVEFDASSSFVQRIGRNPQTGKEIQIAAKNVVKFKAGADLSKKVN